MSMTAQPLERLEARRPFPARTGRTGNLIYRLITTTLMTGAYGKTWPDRDALMFALTYLRQFAADWDDRQSATSKAGHGHVAAAAHA